MICRTEPGDSNIDTLIVLSSKYDNAKSVPHTLDKDLKGNKLKLRLQQDAKFQKHSCNNKIVEIKSGLFT